MNDGPRTGVVLLSDIVLLRRPQDDYVLCNARSCPKSTPEAKKPVFIVSQAQLERDGITFLYGRAERVMILPNDLKVPITPRGDQYYLESATCMKRGEDVRLRVEAQGFSWSRRRPTILVVRRSFAPLPVHASRKAAH